MPRFRSDKDVTYPTLPQSIETLQKESSKRRISVPYYDFQDDDEEPPPATTPWEITHINQVREWAEKDPQTFLLVLDDMREQRDLGVKSAELYGVLSQEKDAVQQRLEDQEHQSETEKAELEDLRRRHEELRRKYDSEKQKRRQLQDNVRRSPSRDPTLETQASNSSTSAKRSQKLPDPPLFDDGTEPTWEDWINKVHYKLEVNADHFETERARIGYVLSRLQGKTCGHTYARSPQTSSNPYLHVDELLQDPAETYDDPDKERNYRRQYNAVVQGSQRFIDFYSEFKRLSSYLHYGENQLIDVSGISLLRD